MSVFHVMLGRKSRLARLLAFLSMSLLVYILVATPRQNPSPSPTPSLAVDGDGDGRAREQREARLARKEANEKWHKEVKLDARSGGDTCYFNLDHLSRALQSYRFDHTTYPVHLNELVPDYLDHLPTCPHSGKSDYTLGYHPSPYGYRYQMSCPHCGDWKVSSEAGLEWVEAKNTP